jgi:hypothetical protein
MPMRITGRGVAGSATGAASTVVAVLPASRLRAPVAVAVTGIPASRLWRDSLASAGFLVPRYVTAFDHIDKIHSTLLGHDDAGVKSENATLPTETFGASSNPTATWSDRALATSADRFRPGIERCRLPTRARRRS